MPEPSVGQSATSDVLVGIQKCGCITFFCSEPALMTRRDERALTRIVRNGGSTEHRDMDQLRGDPDFMPWECPHDPKGWEPNA